MENNDNDTTTTTTNTDTNTNANVKKIAAAGQSKATNRVNENVGVVLKNADTGVKTITTNTEEAEEESPQQPSQPQAQGQILQTEPASLQEEENQPFWFYGEAPPTIPTEKIEEALKPQPYIPGKIANIQDVLQTAIPCPFGCGYKHFNVDTLRLHITNHSEYYEVQKHNERLRKSYLGLLNKRNTIMEQLQGLQQSLDSINAYAKRMESENSIDGHPIVVQTRKQYLSSVLNGRYLGNEFQGINRGTEFLNDEERKTLEQALGNDIIDVKDKGLNEMLKYAVQLQRERRYQL